MMLSKRLEWRRGLKQYFNNQIHRNIDLYEQRGPADVTAKTRKQNV